MSGSCNTSESYQIHKVSEYDSLKRKDHLRNLDADGKLALKWILNIHTSHIIRILQTQDRRVFLNTVMTLRAP
jgi:hypothetical protein